MVQQFYLWVYTQKNLKQGLEERYLDTHVHSSIIHGSQKGGCNPSAHQGMSR